MGWGQCGHGLSSRPRESCDLHILTPLLHFFGYLVGAATELFSGTLKLRYSSTPFSKKFPSWPVPDLSSRYPVVGSGPGPSVHFPDRDPVRNSQRNVFASLERAQLSSVLLFLLGIFQRLSDGKG